MRPAFDFNGHTAIDLIVDEHRAGDEIIPLGLIRARRLTRPHHGLALTNHELHGFSQSTAASHSDGPYRNGRKRTACLRAQDHDGPPDAFQQTALNLKPYRGELLRILR